MSEPAVVSAGPVEAVEAVVVVDRPALSAVPVEWRRQEHSGVSEGWLFAAPFIGVTFGTAIHLGGVFGIAGCVAGGVVGMLSVREVGARVRRWERDRSLRNRRVGYLKALPAGGDG